MRRIKSTLSREASSDLTKLHDGPSGCTAERGVSRSLARRPERPWLEEAAWPPTDLLQTCRSRIPANGRDDQSAASPGSCHPQWGRIQPAPPTWQAERPDPLQTQGRSIWLQPSIRPTGGRMIDRESAADRRQSRCETSSPCRRLPLPDRARSTSAREARLQACRHCPGTVGPSRAGAVCRRPLEQHGRHANLSFWMGSLLGEAS